jgi:hypothetical protein
MRTVFHLLHILLFVVSPHVSTGEVMRIAVCMQNLTSVMVTLELLHKLMSSNLFAPFLTTLGEVMRKRLRRITEELGALSTSLPLSSDSSILLAVNAQRMDVLRALLLPHPDTPYGGGAFMFDILLPDSYPDRPPMVSVATVCMPCYDGLSDWCIGVTCQ